MVKVKSGPMWGCKLEWESCPDGVGLVDSRSFSDSEKAYLAYVVDYDPETDIDGPPEGLYFWPNSMAPGRKRNRFVIELNDLSDPVCIAFLNAKSEEKLCGFFSRYGLFHRDQRPVHHWNADGYRAIIGEIIGQITAEPFGPLTEFNKYFHQEALMGSATIYPQLVVGGEMPQLVFQAENLVAYMMMETAAIAEAGASMVNCEYCDHIFLTGQRTFRRSTARFCCDRCRTYAGRRKAREAKLLARLQ